MPDETKRDNTSQMASTRAARRFGVAVGAATAVVLGVFAWLGIVNGDEGWYGLAAQAVTHGRLPYRDFAFAQGPVYPYVLSPFVWLWPNVAMTRMVSVALASVAVGLLVAAAHRHSGRLGAIAATVTLAALFPSLTYWLAVTKTYALCFLLVVTIVVLLLAGRPERNLPLVAVVAVVLGVTRTTGLAITALVVLAVLVRAPNPATRKRIGAAAALTALPFVGYAAIEWNRVRWNLFDYHHLSNHRDPGAGKYVSRSVAVLQAWPGAMFLALATLIAVVASPAGRRLLRRRLDLVAVVVGCIGFVVLHESGSVFFSEEYLSPVMGLIVVGCAVLLVRLALDHRGHGHERAARVTIAVLVIGIVATASTGGHSDYLGAPGWNGSIAGLDPVVRCVDAHSRPSDTVLALYLEEVVLQSRRHPVPGVSLGAFSYQSISSRDARRLHILNQALLADTLQRHPPKVMVLTPFDFDEFARGGWFSRKYVSRASLDAQFLKYDHVCTAYVTRHVFENNRVKVDVYALRPVGLPPAGSP